MSDGIERGFISFDAAHTYATLAAATFAWIDRPGLDDLRAFCNLFATTVLGPVIRESAKLRS